MSTTVTYPAPPYEHLDEKTAWRGGCWSGRHGLPKKANPYLPGLPALAWTAGWTHETSNTGTEPE